MQLATRMSRLGTETAFEVLVRARALEAQGKDVIHLEVGEPDFDTPANIIEAGAEALRSGWTHYGPAPGLPQLREAIANYLNSSRGTSYYPGQHRGDPGRQADHVLHDPGACWKQATKRSTRIPASRSTSR